MLIKCPECDLQISDKAFSCPHCGLPLKESRPYSTRKTKKHMRLPNGFGNISEIKGRNLRNPYRVMITIGVDSKGKLIRKLLKPQAYFQTYNDAYAALLEYNRNPYDLEDDLTVKQLYEKWTDYYFDTLSNNSSERTITSAWSYCSSVYDMRVKDIRARHIKGCIEYGTTMVNGKERKTTPNMKDRIKSMFNLMLDYAVEYELIDRNYARTFSLGKDVYTDIEKTRRAHIPFKEDEMKKLWENHDKIEWADIIIFQCYSGWRPQEIGLIELKNVDLDKGVIKGGIKTESGTDRIVPIHPNIIPIVNKYYKEASESGSKYLINCTDGKTHTLNTRFTYDKYAVRFKKVIDRLELNPDHRPHDGRKHFVTTAKKYNVDEYAIKYIIGHKINDITERVYTERDIKWLKEEIEKIK